MSNEKIYWSKQDTPVELHSMLSALAEEYPVRQGRCKDGIQVKFIKSKITGCSAVSREGGCATVEYAGISMASRAVGTIFSGLESKESAVFKSLGIMLDCSRNAVMTVQHFKKWLRRLALMGYNHS